MILKAPATVPSANVKANDIGGLLAQTSIRAVFANGDKACQLYRKYCMEQAGREIIRLPSTSPANAGMDVGKAHTGLERDS